MNRSRNTQRGLVLLVVCSPASSSGDPFPNLGARGLSYSLARTQFFLVLGPFSSRIGAYGWGLVLAFFSACAGVVSADKRESAYSPTGDY